jgi:hypothetical protein
MSKRGKREEESMEEKDWVRLALVTNLFTSFCRYIQIGDELKARENRTYPDNKLALSGEVSADALRASQNNYKRMSLSLPTSPLQEKKQREREDKWLLGTRTFKANYNWTQECTVRTLYLKKDEKVDFYTKMASARYQLTLSLFFPTD